MKILLALLFILSSGTAYSAKTETANANAKPNIIAKPNLMATPNTTATSNTNYIDSNTVFNVGAAIGAIEEQLTFGAILNLAIPVTLDGNNFEFGVLTGFLYSSRSESISIVTVKSKSWSIPFLLNGIYKFNNSVEFIKPYIGAGFGLSVDHIKGDVSIANVSTPVSDTSVHFAMLVRPGLTLGTAQSWFIEVPFGSIFKGFAILPTIGFHF